MPMDLSQPAIPSINTATIVATMAIVTIKCPCKTIIMGQMGAYLTCASCRRVWYVEAKSQIKISEIMIDLTKEPNLLTQ
jgi:hypothetical protein